ncbi:AraC family transcriptional regulator [Marinobacterium rhizophilum]|uniref:AraC family transcriptional regulator n=1 Tax=Marinobacterium rhizophilum TaxID=420402 RepID=UPI000366DE45|nr:AraC family transcriptional regulator [Marinobacterium rhizophilum]
MTDKARLQPEFERVDQLGDESIRYLQHGYPCELVRWHYHSEYELHLIKATSGKVFVGDYIGNFNANQLILVGPNLPHNWISQLPEGESVALRDRVINFSHELIETCSTTFPEMQSLAPFWERAQYGIEFLDPAMIHQADALFEDLANARGFRRLTRFWTLLDLLAATSEYRVLSSTNYIPIADKKTLEKVNEAVQYIVAHYNQDLALEDVASRLDMGPSYFSKFFKKATGRRFIDFVNGLRINLACERLAHTDEPITDICFFAGFNNIANFNRRFHAIKGMTPSEYRRTSSDLLYRG